MARQSVRKPAASGDESQTRRIRKVTRRFVLLALAAMAGCAPVGPNYHTPATTMPAGFSEAAPVSRRLGPPTPSEQKPTDLGLWWTSFHDPELDSLINRAVARNLTLKMATERIFQARAQRQIAASQLFPQIGGIGSYTRAKSSANGSEVGVVGTGTSSATTGGTTTGGNTTGGTGTGGTTGGTTTGGGAGTTGTGTGGTSAATAEEAATSGKAINLYQLGFDATWELDVFGGIRRQVEAETYNVQAAVEDRRDTLITLLGDVAGDYIALRAAQKQLDITQQNLKSQQDTLKLTQTRYKAGLTSDLDVANAEAQVASTASDIPGFQTSIRTSVFQLGVLLAEDPDALSKELGTPSEIPVAFPNVPIGLPSELLRRRPDVRRAERQLAAATANIGVATADLFPQFSLTGETGLQSLQLKRLVQGRSWFYSIGPSMDWDLFDAGRVRANIDVQNSLQRQALSTYQGTVLQALADVDTALVTYNQEQARRVSLAQSVASNQRAVDLSVQLYTRGLLDFLSVLDAERSLFAAQSSLVQSDQNVSTDLVSLYKALGGGWQSGI